jgi:hypothetical protein
MTCLLSLIGSDPFKPFSMRCRGVDAPLVVRTLPDLFLVITRYYR